jgi:hypothetical protein
MKRICALLLAAVPLLGSAGESVEHEFLYQFLAGRYVLIGKKPGSDTTYLGKVVLDHEADHLLVERVIDGITLTGEGVIEHALGADQADVLRVRFVEDGVSYEATYLWSSDLDNYARLTGYLYRVDGSDESPGLEALFIDHSLLR